MAPSQVPPIKFVHSHVASMLAGCPPAPRLPPCSQVTSLLPGYLTAPRLSPHMVAPAQFAQSLVASLLPGCLPLMFAPA